MDWHLLDVNNQKMIATLIRRGQKATFVRVPFFEVTLMAYTKVCSYLFMENFFLRTQYRFNFTLFILDYEYSWQLHYLVE